MSEHAATSTLPRFVEPRKLAQMESVYQGRVPVEQLERLGQAAAKVQSVKAKMAFGINDTGHRVLTGSVEAALVLECQRCLEPVSQDISFDFCLAVVRDEEASKQLPSELDPWIVVDLEADLYAMVEDEILLNLPIVVYHNYQCVDMHKMSSSGFDEDDHTLQQSPFGVLADLKEKREK